MFLRLSTRTLKAAYRFAACNTPTVSAPSLACLLLLLFFFDEFIHLLDNDLYCV